MDSRHPDQPSPEGMWADLGALDFSTTACGAIERDRGNLRGAAKLPSDIRGEPVRMSIHSTPELTSCTFDSRVVRASSKRSPQLQSLCHHELLRDEIGPIQRNPRAPDRAPRRRSEQMFAQLPGPASSDSCSRPASLPEGCGTVMGRAKGVHMPPSFHPESARQSGKGCQVHSTLFVIESQGPFSSWRRREGEHVQPCSISLDSNVLGRPA